MKKRIRPMLGLEQLEPRYALAAGIGTGLAKGSVAFVDADGDTVTVKLTKAPKDVKFDIALVGGATNNADIASITVRDVNPANGTLLDSNAILSLVAAPKKLAAGGFGPGFTDVAEIESSVGLAGISLRSAVADQIDITGNLDSLIDDLRPFKVKPFAGVDPREDASFGGVHVSGDAGQMLLRGLADADNEFAGNGIAEPIAVDGSLGKFISRFSDLVAPLTVSGGGLSSLAVGNIDGPVNVTGTIGSVVAQDVSGSITAAGAITKLNVGDILGTIAAASIGQIKAASIRGANISATASIGPIKILAHGDDAIANSNFQAGGDIGDITVLNTSQAAGANAIAGSIFRAGGSIGNVRAETGDPAALTGTADITHGAILSSGFDARQSIGNVTTKGHINNSVLVAGIDLGSDFNIAGAGTFGGATPFGFGGVADTPGAGAPKIGDITVGTAAGGAPGSLGNSTLLAGITAAGADAVFGERGVATNADGSFKLTQNDAFLAGSAIGGLTVAGTLRQAVVEAGAIASASGKSITVAGIGEDSTNQSGNFIAVDPAGTGLGPVNSTIVLTSTIDSTSAIVGGVFQSASSIGNFTATANGVRTNSGGTNFFGGFGFSVNIFAGTTIGDVKGICNATGGVTAQIAYGIGNATVKAGLNGTGLGGIGNIVGSVTGANAAPGRGFFGGLSFDAAAGTAHGSSPTAGGIASITGITNTSGANSFGIGSGSTFRAIGNIGPILSTTEQVGGVAITQTTISTGGNLSTITTTGDVSSTRFLAGFDVGSNLIVDATDAAVANRSVGAVSITGAFLSSDLIASVNPGADLIWGNQTGDADAGGGNLTTVTITVGAAVASNPGTALSHGIEWGGTPAVFSIGGTIFIPTFANTPQFLDNSPAGAGAVDALIRDLTSP